MHLQDTDRHADRHWGIGAGTINWRAFFPALRSTGTDPRLILELREVDDILPSAAWLTGQGLVR